MRTELEEAVIAIGRVLRTWAEPDEFYGDWDLIVTRMVRQGMIGPEAGYEATEDGDSGQTGTHTHG